MNRRARTALQGFSVLARLKQRVERCHRCFPDRTNRPVSGVSLESRPHGLFLVGQAPGVREPRAGHMFAWTAGKRLFAWLSEIGLQEEKIRRFAALCAVARCFPGKHPSGKGDLPPSAAMIRRCTPFLSEHLRLLRPKAIVPIGVHAIRWFLGDLPLGKAVGRVWVWNKEGFTAFVFPLPHPSGASLWIHDPANRRKLSRALFRLKQFMIQEEIYEWFCAKERKFRKETKKT